MSILTRWLHNFGAGHATDKVADPSNQILVVDAQSMAASRRYSPRVSPRDQVDVLEELARIVKREGVTIVAVLEGDPLREVANGGMYQGVEVFFSPGSAEHTENVIRIYKAKSRGKRAILISGDRDMDAAARAAGAAYMRLSTFRRGFDDFRENNNNNHGDRRRNPSSQPSRDRDRRRRPDPNRQEQANPSESVEEAEDRRSRPNSDVSRESRPAQFVKPTESRDEPGTGSSITDLIDLV